MALLAGNLDYICTVASRILAWLKKKCLSLLGRLSIDDILSSSIPEGLRSPLESLPQELVVEVLAHLPLESQACLAMTSRTMARRLGTQYWHDLRADRNKHNGPLRRYLQLIQHDRPSMYYCYGCVHLYSLRRDHHCLEIRLDDIPLIANLGVGQPYYPFFHELQLPMARYRYYGFRKSQFDKLYYTRDDYAYLYEKPLVFEAEARCVSGHLLIRTQHLIEIDYSSPETSRHTVLDLGGVFCNHFHTLWHERWRPKFWSEHLIDAAKRFSECPHDHTLPEDCNDCGFRPICPGCPTEMSFQKVHHKVQQKLHQKLLQKLQQKVQTGLDRHTAVVTRWKDLGSVLTPEDPVWRAHTTCSDHFPPYPQEFKSWGWTNPQWQLANIRQRFENQPGTKVAELTLANLKRVR